MKSASYKRRFCDKCRHDPAMFSKLKGPLYASQLVRYWVIKRVEPSRYIWELGKGCQGCCEVLEDKARVLANLLYKLGIERLM